MLDKTVTRSSDSQKGIKMFPAGYQFPNGEFKTFRQMDEERMATFRSRRSQ